MKNSMLKLMLSAAALVVAALTSLTIQPLPTTAAVQDAATIYKTKCASCHGLDGSGNTAAGKKLKVRDLRSAEVKKMSEPQMHDIIAKGKGKMPAGKGLNDDQVKQLVTHVRSMK
ncbi:MAG TPA: cytochrome c [Blastocatellia bacterium]|nr:cytochrome c [Blastocatellia bacterium]